MNGADELLAALLRGDRRRLHDAEHHGASSADGEFFVRASSASAPATSRRWRRSTSATTARSTAPTRATADRPARRCAPARSRSAEQGDRPSRPATAGGARCLRRGSCSRTSTSRTCRRSTATEQRGGYGALEQALDELEPEDLIASSRTRGCAAAAAPVSRWARRARFLPRGEMEKYLCCNADESEPGRVQGPRADEEEPAPADRGLRDRRARGRRHATPSSSSAASTGRSPTSSTAPSPRPTRPAISATTSSAPGHRVELVVHRGAGAYICGEETALLDSLEGKRGNPRLKPPFPAIQGLYGGPTLINNVETLSNVPHIVSNGADWFKRFGTEQSPGTKVVSVSGCVAAARQLRDRARDPRARDHLRPRRRPAARAGGSRPGFPAAPRRRC